MTILTIVIIFLFLIALAVSFGLAKKLSSPEYQKSNIEMRCTIFTTIITPVLTVLSVILVIYTLQIDSKNSKQDKYNTEFSILFAEMRDFINNLSVEIKYNERSENPITISKMEVIDELAYYLKRGEKVRQLYSEEIAQISFPISNDNTELLKIPHFFVNILCKLAHFLVAFACKVTHESVKCLHGRNESLYKTKSRPVSCRMES